MTDAPDDTQARTDGERPTQKTIAKRTGLAVATVSRALSDAPDIGEGTKRRVRAVAEELGYRPDRAGVRLRTGKTNVISLVLPTQDEIMNHAAVLISSIAEGLRDTPYHMIITPYFQGEDPMNPVRYIVETRSADALILNQTTPNDPRVAYLMSKGFPFATHGRTDWCDKHAYFDFDNHAYGSLACKRLAARDRKHLVMILPPMDQYYARMLSEGAVEAAGRQGQTITCLAGCTSDDATSVVSAAMREHLRRAPQTDGVICASPAAAMGAATAAEDLGRALGQDIDITSKEAIPFLKQFRREILSLQEDVVRAGRFLARAAMERASAPQKPPMQQLDVPIGFD